MKTRPAANVPASTSAVAPTSGGVDDGAAYTISGGEKVEHRTTRLPASPPFLLQYHPDRWTCIEEGGRWYVVPSLARLALSGGINNVRSALNAETGRVDYDLGAALPLRSKAGFTPLPIVCNGVRYCKAVEAFGSTPERPVYAHVHHFERPLPGMNRTVPQPGYAAWLRSLCWGPDAKYPPPERYHLEILKERFEQVIGELATQSEKGNVKARPDLVRAEAALKAILADIELHDKEAAGAQE